MIRIGGLAVKIACLIALAASSVSIGAGQIQKEQSVVAESSHQVADQPSQFFGPFRINGEKPEGFEGFDFFVLSYKDETDAARDNREALVPDKEGNVPVRGELVTAKGTPLPFATVRISETGKVTVHFRGQEATRVVRTRPIKLDFTTVEVKGVRYDFSGEYLESAEEENGGFTFVRGILKKYKQGKLVAEAKTSFRQSPYEELTADFAR